MFQYLFIYLRTQHLHMYRALITPPGPGGGDAPAWAFDVPEKRWRDGEMVLGVSAAMGSVCVGGDLVMSPQEAADGRRDGGPRSEEKGSDGGRKEEGSSRFGPLAHSPAALGLGACTSSEEEGEESNRLRKAGRKEPPRPCGRA